MAEEAKGAADLKKELQKLMETIVLDGNDDDVHALEATDYAIEILNALKGLKLDQRQEFDRGSIDGSYPVPVEFRCPISGLLLSEPVVLASGQTFDQTFIQKWLQNGHQTCPRTEEILLHTVLTPNLSVKRLIEKWCRLHNYETQRLAVDADEGNAPSTCGGDLAGLLERVSSSSLSDSKRAAKELRMLTSRYSSFKVLFLDISCALAIIFNPIVLDRVYSDADILEDFIAMILNISVHDINLAKLMSENPSAISLVIQSLKDRRVETRSHAAAALSVLTALDMGKSTIGRSGAIKCLLHVIEDGHPLVLKDAAQALHNLCTLVENREKSVFEGAVVVIMNKIIGVVLLDEMLEILAMLSSHHRAVEEMEEHGGVFLFLNILKEKTSEHSKEISVSILYTMCFSDRRRLRAIREVENAREILADVAQTGTSRAKRKANGILERMNRFASVSCTYKSM